MPCESEMANVKSDTGEMGTITDEQLEKIEAIIQRRDCTFRHLVNNSSLEILYGDGLSSTWKNCHHDDEHYTRLDMEKDILNAAQFQ